MNTELRKDQPSDWWVTENLRTTPERTAAVNMLIKMHTYKRPAFSKTDRKFIKDFIKCLPGVTQDTFGNLYGRIGATPVLFSSHTDTVHEAKGFQIVGFLKNELGVAQEDKSGSTCLGADDTVGVWHMIQMYMAKVPGLYVWHREEEKGRKGSKWIVEHNTKALEGIKVAIAFDRRADDSVITHQLGDRCCSDAFGRHLAKLLNEKSPFNYKLDTTGSFTDTATYTDLIGECTNLSVGYTAAHSKWEMLDLEHAMNLRDVLCSPAFSIGLAEITVERKPGEKEIKSYTDYTKYTRYAAAAMMGEYGFDASDYYGAHYYDKHYGHRTNFNKMYGGKSETPSEQNPEPLVLPNTGQGEPRTVDIVPKTEIDEIVTGTIVPPEDDTSDDVLDRELKFMTKLVERNPEATLEMLQQIMVDSPDAIALLLQDSGIEAKDMMDEIMCITGGTVNC